MVKNKIVVCEYSKIVQNVIKSILGKIKEEIVFFDNAYDALLFIQSNSVVLLISSIYLEPFTGFHLAHLIKADSKTEKIKVLLYYSEETKLKSFYAEKTHADAFLFFNANTTREFCEEVELLLGEVEIFENNVNEISEKDLLVSALKSTEKTFFNYIFLESLFEMNLYLENTASLLKNLLYLIAKIFEVEIFSFFIFNEGEVQKHSLISNSLSKIEENDFYKVSKLHFGSYVPDDFDLSLLEYNEEQSYRFEKKVKTKQNVISSYEHFVLYANSFVGTFHIGAVEFNYFTEQELKLLHFFCEKIGFLIEMSLNFTSVINKEMRMKKTFSRFVPEEIIDNILGYEGEAKQLVGEKRMVAVVIVDIRDFTAISEINTPENVVSFLNLYFTHMVEIIKKNGGAVDKFMGDSILALFGATTSYEDNAQRAVRTALEMQEVIHTIDTSLLIFPENHELKIGIGIHQGNVVVGNIGCQEKIDYTVIGDSVNLASRLESLTKQYGAPIIISDAIKEELDQTFSTRHLDIVRVKGKSIPVSIYRVMQKEDAYSTEFQETITKAMELYILGAWNLAYNYFTKALDIMPQDKATMVLQNRCKSFASQPPINWDGAITLLNK